MKQSSGVIVFLNRLLYVGIFSGMVLLCFPVLHGIYDVNWRHMAVLVATTVILSAFCLLHGRQRIYAVALCIFVFVFLLFSIGSERVFLYFSQVLDLTPILSEEMIYIEPGRVFLLVVICYPVQLLLGKNIYLRIASADIIGGWLLYMLKAPKMGVVFFVLYIGLIIAERVRTRRKKMENENVQAYILGILPFLVLYAVLLCFMPMRVKPYDWQWAKNIYREAENKITMYAENLWNTGNEYFSGTTSGFSDEGGFFSDILQDDRQLMTLRIGAEKDTPVYLAGKFFDSFNGREWESVRESADGIRNKGGDHIDESQRATDIIETVCALEIYAGNNVHSYHKNIKMDVLYQYFHTYYVLAPSKTWKIESKDRKIKYHQESDDFVFDRKAGYGTEYTLRFCLLNMDREEFYRFLEENISEDAEYSKVWSTAAQQYLGKSIPIEKLYAYREEVTEQYLPKTDISPEVEEWLAFITADANTDVEKLKYIESALASMTYNTSPGGLPKTVRDETDFLDYFLMEKQEGYCAHYATAFVLLARAEGFPARYVQGFCVPVVSGEETFVYTNMAHAWPEVYIEGKGWVPFEPTPGFGVNRYAVREEDADNDIWDGYTGTPNSYIPEDSSVSGYDATEENVSERKAQSRWLSYAGRIVEILLIGIVLAFGIDWLSEKYRDKKRSLRERYELAVLHNLQIISMLGYRRETYETYHELTMRIRQENASEDRDENREEDKRLGHEISCGFIETYERYLYGALEIDDQILNEVLAERKQLLTRLKEYKRRTYMFCRIRLYIVRYR